MIVLVPGQGVRINYGAIIEIFIQQLDRERGLDYLAIEPIHLTFAQRMKYSSQQL